MDFINKNNGRLLFALPFILGLGHFSMKSIFGGYFMWGDIVVLAIVTLYVLGGFGLLRDESAKIATGIISLGLIAAIGLGHVKGVMGAADETSRIVPMVNTLKGVGLLGAALFLMGNVPGGKSNFVTGILARTLFSVPFLLFGLMHVFQGKGFADSVLQGWPLAHLLVILTGILMFLAALPLIAGKMVNLAGNALIVLMGVFIASLHIPNVLGQNVATDGTWIFVYSTSILHDLALMGGAIFITATYKD